MEEDSVSEMEEWGDLVPDPGHTRGMMSLFKQTLHIYWVMKRLLPRALEQVVGEMVEIAQGIPNLKKDMKNLQIMMFMQESKLDRIQQQKMELSPAPSDSAVAPAIMDSEQDDSKE